MTNKKIAEVAYKTLLINQRILITLNNGERLVGYFENNQQASIFYNQNKWNFVLTMGEKREVSYDGNDFAKLEIIFY